MVIAVAVADAMTVIVFVAVALTAVVTISNHPRSLQDRYRYHDIIAGQVQVP